MKKSTAKPAAKTLDKPGKSVVGKQRSTAKPSTKARDKRLEGKAL